MATIRVLLPLVSECWGPRAHGPRAGPKLAESAMCSALSCRPGDMSRQPASLQRVLLDPAPRGGATPCHTRHTSQILPQQCQILHPALSQERHTATRSGPAGTELKERTSAGAALSSSEMGRPFARGAALARAPRLDSLSSVWASCHAPGCALRELKVCCLATLWLKRSPAQSH